MRYTLRVDYEKKPLYCRKLSSELSEEGGGSDHHQRFFVTVPNVHAPRGNNMHITYIHVVCDTQHSFCT